MKESWNQPKIYPGARFMNFPLGIFLVDFWHILKLFGHLLAELWRYRYLNQWYQTRQTLTVFKGLESPELSFINLIHILPNLMWMQHSHNAHEEIQPLIERE